MVNSDIVTLFSNIINQSYEFAEAKLKIGENNAEKGIQALFQDYCDYIKKINKSDKLALLISVLTEAYFNKMIPLIALPAQEILLGDSHRIAEIKRLYQELQENEMKAAWKSISTEFIKIMNSMEFQADSELFTNVIANVHILIDAFSFLDNFDFTGQDKYHKIKQVRKGNISKATPVFINTVTVFRNIHDITTAVENSGVDNLIMFAAVRKLNKDTNDYFEDWKRGSNERKHNVMRYEHLTEEEYMEAEDEWRRMVYLVVKNGENIWLLPHKNQSSQTIMKDFYEYGQRKTYFPYQVLFIDFNKASEDTTMLATTNNSYKLSKFVDEEQKMFIPILFYETKRRFFDEEPPMLETVVLPQETVLMLPGNVISKNALAVVSNKTVTFSSENYRINNVFSDEPHTLALMDALNISENDILDAPILPTSEDMTIAEYDQKIVRNLQSAYKTIIAKRLEDYQKKEEETLEIRFAEYKAFLARQSQYESMLRDEKFILYSNCVVDKKYGVTSKSMNEYHGRSGGKNWYKTRKWIHAMDPDNGCIISTKKYPVCIEVRPYNKKEILEFYGWEDNEELPFLIRFRDEILSYYGFDTINRSMTHRDYPGLINITGMNVCVGKVYYQKLTKVWGKTFTDIPRYELYFSETYRDQKNTFIEEAKSHNYQLQQYYIGGGTTVVAIQNT